MNTLVANKDAVRMVRTLEAWGEKQPQVPIDTQHNFWAGCYARTICIPAGACITGAEICIPTLLIVQGDVMVGDMRLSGYYVLEGQAGRKNAFLALADTWLTMVFATDAHSVEEAEEAFTHEAHKLGTRK